MSITPGPAPRGLAIPCALVSALLSCIPLAQAIAQEPFFMVLPNLPSGSENIPWAISADGSVVVGECTSANTAGINREAYRWTLAGGIEALGDLPGGEFHSSARGVSPDGSVIVGNSKAGGATSVDFGEAFRWTEPGGMVSIGYLGGDAIIFARGEGASDGGLTVVGQTTGSNAPFKWTSATGMVELARVDENVDFGRARAITPDATFIVGIRGVFGEPNEAVRWGPAGITRLGHLPNGVGSAAFDVSDDGSVVVGYDSIQQAGGGQLPKAFRWSAGTGMVGLGFLPNSGEFPESRANAVSGDGSVVVGYGNPAFPAGRAFIWDTANGMRNLQEVLTNDLGLDLGGYILGEATDISADGRTLIGRGSNSTGWIAFLGPPACEGDVDADGDTDVFDFSTLASNFGTSVPPSTMGDLDGDGDVDIFDAAILFGAFGCTS